MFEFQTLEVYKKAKLFHIDCKQIMSGKTLDHYVVNQLGRASFSVVLNIAEGAGKFSSPSKRNYYINSRASVLECVAILDVLSDQKLIDKLEVDHLTNKADELSRMLYVMAKNLER